MRDSEIYGRLRFNNNTKPLRLLSLQDRHSRDVSPSNPDRKVINRNDGSGDRMLSFKTVRNLLEFP